MSARCCATKLWHSIWQQPNNLKNWLEKALHITRLFAGVRRLEHFFFCAKRLYNGSATLRNSLWGIHSLLQDFVRLSAGRIGIYGIPPRRVPGMLPPIRTNTSGFKLHKISRKWSRPWKWSGGNTTPELHFNQFSLLVLRFFTVMMS